MSSERQNKAPDWKQSLLQWEQAGGHTEPKEDLLWERLQEKLEPKKKGVFFLSALIERNRRTTAAAVAVLILLAVSLFFLSSNDDNPEKKDVVKAPSSESPATKKEDKAVDVKDNYSPAPITIKNEEISAADKKRKEKHWVPMRDQKIHEQKYDPTLPVVDLIPESPLQATIEKKEPEKQPVATTTPYKRKLRVVHVNELNAPPPPTYASLKEEWKLSTNIQEDNTPVPAPSIWPGKNKPKTSISLDN